LGVLGEELGNAHDRRERTLGLDQVAQQQQRICTNRATNEGIRSAHSSAHAQAHVLVLTA
jgi:hypothetical protein